MQMVTIHTYGASFDVPVSWLLKNVQENTLKEFLNNYTWDDGEWLYRKYQGEGK